ncbi:MAG: glycerophosphodiester phosphodiesterase family protein [Spirochaetes bacterium]|nr:glycerophosphodiester phosphodiesterase family protein [Spirochaetota bacterium]
MFTLIFLLTLHCLAADTPSDTQKQKRPLVVAHRGGSKLAPENTLEAFSNSIALGADAVELDVHLSKDGVPVVIHDPVLDKTTDGFGLVENHTLLELKKLDAGVRFKGTRGPRKQGIEIQRIPSLDEVLQRIKGKANLQLEIKVRQDGTRYPGIERKVLEALRNYTMVKDTVLLSFDFPTLRAVKELDPDLTTCALIGTRYLNTMLPRGVPAIAEELTNLRVEYVGIDERKVSSGLLEALRTRGLRVGVWTVNDEVRMRFFIQQGVDFITTDRPDLLKRLVEELTP